MQSVSILGILAGILTLSPVPAPNGTTPLGRYGPIVATGISLLVVAAAITVHLAAVFGYGTGTDPFIDSAALLVIGVVLGASALGGQAQQAHEIAVAANRRLDAAGVPAAPPAESTT